MNLDLIALEREDITERKAVDFLNKHNGAICKLWFYKLKKN
jgi:hypothetical protein